MLLSIRHWTKGWLAWLIIGAIAIVFVLLGIEVAGPGIGQGTAFKVNSHEVSEYELQRRITALRRQELLNNPQFSEMGAIGELWLQQMAKNSIIENTVLSQDAYDLGIRVSEYDLDQIILNNPLFQVDGQYSEGLALEFAASQYLSVPELYLLLKDQSVIGQVQQAIIQTDFMLPSELIQLMSLNGQTRSFDYLQIPIDAFKDTISISNDTINDYYNENQDNFVTTARVKIDYVELTEDHLRDNIYIDDADVFTAYQSNQPLYSEPKAVELKHILLELPRSASSAEISEKQQLALSIIADLENGEDFTKAVQLYSDDTYSAEEGGYLGKIRESNITDHDYDKFETEVLSLNNIGLVTEPILSDYGWHIIDVISIDESTVIPFDEVESMIRDSLMADALAVEFQQQFSELSALSYESPENLEAVSEVFNLPIKTSNYFTANGTRLGISSNQSVVEAAFSSDVLELGYNSDAILIDPSTAVVISINEYQPQDVKPLDDVYNEIEQLILAEEAKVVAGLFASDVRGQDYEIKLPNGDIINWESYTSANRQNESPIVQAAFDIGRPQEQGNSLSIQFLPELSSFIVFDINSVQNANVDIRSDEFKEILASDIDIINSQMLYQAYAMTLIEQADVTD